MPDPLIGKIIGGCEVLSPLGKGGMSVIYLARQKSVNREVAVKVLSATLLGDSTFMERFSREVETTARLQHPRIVPIFDYGEHDGQPYIVMAHIPGGSLADLISFGPMTMALTSRIISEVAEALDFAHGHGVIHRDIKPANILLDSLQNAILTDFGVARVIAATQQLTRDSILGTPSHLAPEMLADNNEITSAADIYALGVTLYQMLTGAIPFGGDTAVQMLWAHVNQPAPLITAQRADLPPALDAITQMALAKSPAARYHSAGELAEDLAEAIEGRAASHAAEVPAARGGGEDLAISEHVATSPDIKAAIRRAIEQVVKIVRPDGITGTGVALPGDTVITCLHVVDGAPGIYIHFRNGEQIEADAVAVEPHTDLAILRLRSAPQRLTEDQLNGIKLSTRALEPGENLAAIGHPLGLDWSVSGGHFNAIRQPGEDPLPDFGITLTAPLVQVDVVINSGNSGGPILDAEGHLVGIADSIINPAVANNIGFAIEGGVALQFWRDHAADQTPLAAYTCDHLHKDGEKYCPLTGKPVKPLEHVDMPTADAVRYTCGHIHPPGLAYCPLIGKPAEQIDATPASTDLPTPVVAAAQFKCSNCGFEFAANLGSCPRCGKPRR